MNTINRPAALGLLLAAAAALSGCSGGTRTSAMYPPAS